MNKGLKKSPLFFCLFCFSALAWWSAEANFSFCKMSFYAYDVKRFMILPRYIYYIYRLFFIFQNDDFYFYSFWKMNNFAYFFIFQNCEKSEIVFRLRQITTFFIFPAWYIMRLEFSRWGFAGAKSFCEIKKYWWQIRRFYWGSSLFYIGVMVVYWAVAKMV